MNIRVPKLLSIPVIMTSGLGKPRTRIAELSSSQGSTLANRLPPCPSFTTKLLAPACAGARDRGVHLLREQQPEAVPVVRAGELLVPLAFVARDHLVDVHRAPHPLHVGDDEHPEPRLVGKLLVTEGGR